MVLRHLLDPSVALCACMLLAFGFIIHRIYLHPLSEYPGPWLAALSDWHAAYFAWSGQLHWTIHEWHQKYGPVIRIGPNTIIFQEIDAFTQIYGPHSNLIKSTTRYAAVSASHTPNLVTEIHQPTVNLKRKAYMDMWSYRSLKETEPRLHALIDTFHTIMDTEDGSAPDARDKDNWSETHDLSETGTYFGFDTVISMGTGHNPNLMLSPEHRYLPDASTIVSIRALASSLQPKLHLWKIDKVLLAPLYKRIMGLGLYYWRTTKAQAAKGITGERNLIQVMMQTKDKKREKEFSTKELWLEIFLLGAVGSTSVGPFVSSIFHFLVHSPAKLERLVAEIRQAFASEDEIAMGSKLDSCEYLWACVDELFRLMPVISNALPRTTPKGGCVIDGHFFGEGTQLGSSIFQIHRNEKYFSEPHEFKPERYLGTKEEKKEGKKNFVAFSRGNRSCPGQGLAYTVMVELVARTLWKYDMRLAPETCCGSLSAQELHPHHEFDSYIGMKTKGPLVQLKKRQDGF